MGHCKEKKVNISALKPFPFEMTSGVRNMLRRKGLMLGGHPWWGKPSPGDTPDAGWHLDGG